MNAQSVESVGNSSQLSTADDPPVKEILWPLHGHVYQQEFMLPAYCKPKLIPLKSVTLEKLEKMQSENAEKLRFLEQQQMESEQAKNGGQTDNASSSVGAQSGPDIWKAEE